MLKLIKLEWKKNHISKYIRRALRVAVVLCLVVYAMAFWGIANDPDGTLDAAEGMNTVSATVELLTGISFLSFTSVMLASFIISSYKNKTMSLMFLYPIKRQKILVSQMIAVWLFCFAALFLTKMLIYLCVYFGAKGSASALLLDFNPQSPSFYIQLIIKSFVTVSMSFISLFVGMALKSSKAAIVTSFILIFFTQGNIGDISLADNAVFPAILTVVSLIFAALSVCNAETRDLL